MDHHTDRLSKLFTQFSATTPEDASIRLQAALAAGTAPAEEDIPTLITQCAKEPDFFVRDMLTWALTRHPVDATLPHLLKELNSPLPQAISQALHTLSKIGDARAYPHITDAHLHSEHTTIARTAWRAAVQLAPVDYRPELADRLASQLGRGDREMRRSLSAAIIALATTTTKASEAGLDNPARENQRRRDATADSPGTPDSHPAEDESESPGEAVIRVLEGDGGVHARATLLMLTDSELSFDTAEYRATHETGHETGCDSAHETGPQTTDHPNPMTSQQ